MSYDQDTVAAENGKNSQVVFRQPAHLVDADAIILSCFNNSECVLLAYR